MTDAHDPAGPAAADPEPDFYTVGEAAKKLNISERTVYELIYSGELESNKFRRARRIPREALDAYIKQSRVPA